MRLISEEAGKVTRLVDQVSQASQEQAHGVEQISRSISEMERITQMSVASSEQSAATSHKVNSDSAHRRWQPGTPKGLAEPDLHADATTRRAARRVDTTGTMGLIAISSKSP